MGRAGRPGRVIDPDAGPLAAFAFDLVMLRRNAAGHPTLRHLETRSGYSKATLSQACSGRTLPTLNATLAYVGACGADMAEWETRWRELAAALRQTGPRLIPDDGDADTDAAPTAATDEMPPQTAPASDARPQRRAVIVPVVVAAAITAALMLIRPADNAPQARPPAATPSATAITQAPAPDDGGGTAGAQPADPALIPSSDQATSPTDTTDTTGITDTTDTTDPALVAATSSAPAEAQPPAPAANAPSCPANHFCWWDQPGFPGTMTNGCVSSALNNGTPWFCSRGFPINLKPVSSYVNNTGYRVWLQQNDDHERHGTELCISPGASDSDLTGDPNTTDRWVWMSNNPAPC